MGLIVEGRSRAKRDGKRPNSKDYKPLNENVNELVIDMDKEAPKKEFIY